MYTRVNEISFFLWPIIITIIIATTNEDNEDNVIVLGEEEWEDLSGNRMEIESFNKFTCESSNEDHIDINYNNKERITSTKVLSTAAIKFYFLCRTKHEEGKPVREYRRKTYNIWKTGVWRINNFRLIYEIMNMKRM